MKRIMLLILSLSLTAFSTARAGDVLNIKTNPFMVVGGGYIALDVDFRVSDKWSLGIVSEFQTFEPQYDIGIRMTRYEQGTFQSGWNTGVEALYKAQEPFNGSASYDPDSDSYCLWDDKTLNDICGYDTKPVIALVLDHNYLWRWKTFNVGLGLGAELATDIDDIANVTLLSVANFSIGWVR
ncbi:MAG: hypothetical protein P8X74_03160 [Reinekea sp.]|jgi:hypothetical protein